MIPALVTYAVSTTLALAFFVVRWDHAETWAQRWQKRHAEARDDANAWCEKARPHEATRAEWRHAIEEHHALRDAKRTLRRRLRCVIREARRWKAEASARGWSRADDARERRAMKALRRREPAVALAILNEGDGE